MDLDVVNRRGNLRWLALGLVAAATLGAVLWFTLPRTIHRERRATSATDPARVPQLPTGSGATSPELSDMLKMARAAFLACGAPAAPTKLPDGRTATRDQMVSAHATVKAFDEATNIYNQCVDSTAYQATVQFKSVATSADTETLSALQVRLHNEAIDRDQDLANRFNMQLRLFKARGTP